MTITLEEHRDLLKKNAAYNRLVVANNRKFKVLRAIGTARMELKEAGWDKDAGHVNELVEKMSMVGALELGISRRCDPYPLEEFVLQGQLVMQTVWDAIRYDTKTRHYSPYPNLAEWEAASRFWDDGKIFRALDKAYLYAVQLATHQEIRHHLREQTCQA